MALEPTGCGRTHSCDGGSVAVQCELLGRPRNPLAGASFCLLHAAVADLLLHLRQFGLQLHHLLLQTNHRRPFLLQQPGVLDLHGLGGVQVGLFAERLERVDVVVGG